MKTLAISAAVLLAASTAAHAEQTKTYTVAAFDKVHVATGITLEVAVGPAQSIRAETGAENFDRLVIEVQEGELMVHRKSEMFSWFGNQPRFKVSVTTPSLRAVKASSGASASVTGDVKSGLDIDVSSGADARVASVVGGDVSIDASSGADAVVAGVCAVLDAEASSGADVDAGKLKCDTVSADASSGGGLAVYAVKAISGSASSGGNVKVLGNPPQVNSDQSSGGTFKVSPAS